MRERQRDEVVGPGRNAEMRRGPRNSSGSSNQGRAAEGGVMHFRWHWGAAQCLALLLAVAPARAQSEPLSVHPRQSYDSAFRGGTLRASVACTNDLETCRALCLSFCEKITLQSRCESSCMNCDMTICPIVQK